MISWYFLAFINNSYLNENHKSYKLEKTLLIM